MAYKVKHSAAGKMNTAVPKPPTAAERRALFTCRQQAAEARALLAGQAKPEGKMARWLARTQAEVGVAHKA